jgi:16S rRNA C1402 (ribose-2'-O) methylase RsmI
MATEHGIIEIRPRMLTSDFQIIKQFADKNGITFKEQMSKITAKMMEMEAKKVNEEFSEKKEELVAIVEENAKCEEATPVKEKQEKVKRVVEKKRGMYTAEDKIRMAARIEDYLASTGMTAYQFHKEHRVAVPLKMWKEGKGAMSEARVQVIESVIGGQ